MESCNSSPALWGLALPVRTPLPHFLFSSPTLRISPEFAVITRKWRYFKAQLSFIWILSSSLVLRRCWQIKFLVPKFWVKSCHCLMPTKERFIWSQFITISSLCRHVDAQAWEIHGKDKTWCWLFLSVKKVHHVEIWRLWGKCLITFKIIEKCAYQSSKTFQCVREKGKTASFPSLWTDVINKVITFWSCGEFHHLKGVYLHLSHKSVHLKSGPN